MGIEKASGMGEVGMICFCEHETDHEIIEAGHNASGIAFAHTGTVFA